VKISEERRLRKRHSLSDLSCSMWSTHDVEVANVSIGGLQVRTNRRLTLEREYAFKLKYGTESFPLSGVVKWCFLVGSKIIGPGEQTPVYSAGLKVFDRNSERFYEALHLTDEACRLPGGDTVVPGEASDTFGIEGLSGEHTAWIQMPLDFRVRATSASGMLIETKETFRAETRLRMQLNIRDKFIEIVCRVAGQAVDPDTGDFLMWVEFITVSQDGRCILDCVTVHGESATVSGGNITGVM